MDAVYISTASESREMFPIWEACFTNNWSSKANCAYEMHIQLQMRKICIWQSLALTLWLTVLSCTTT